MCCGRVAQFLCGCIEVDVGGGDELAVCVAAKNGVHAMEKGGWVVGVIGEGLRRA